MLKAERAYNQELYDTQGAMTSEDIRSANEAQREFRRTLDDKFDLMDKQIDKMDQGEEVN